jgi:2-dehydropantoate 2-reductase
MRILIYGAGAIGSDLGALLTASGEEVTLLARGAQLAALKSVGVTIER